MSHIGQTLTLHLDDDVCGRIERGSRHSAILGASHHSPPLHSAVRQARHSPTMIGLESDVHLLFKPLTGRNGAQR